MGNLSIGTDVDMFGSSIAHRQSKTAARQKRRGGVDDSRCSLPSAGMIRIRFQGSFRPRGTLSVSLPQRCYLIQVLLAMTSDRADRFRRWCRQTEAIPQEVEPNGFPGPLSTEYLHYPGGLPPDLPFTQRRAACKNLLVNAISCKKNKAKTSRYMPLIFYPSSLEALKR
jgi:hypothetical protein